MDFTLQTYRQHLLSLQNAGFSFITFAEYLESVKLKVKSEKLKEHEQQTTNNEQRTTNNKQQTRNLV